MILIIDFIGMGQEASSFQSLWYLKLIYTFHERHFSDRFEKIFMTNVSGAFLTLWRWVKPWLSETLLRRVHVLDSSEINLLYEYIDIQHLPTFLQGKCHCPTECVPLPLSSSP
jgi:hypothetical protein